MKKILCIVSVMAFLLLGSLTVLADPHAVPDSTESNQTPLYYEIL